VEAPRRPPKAESGSACYFLLLFSGLFFDHKNGGNISLRNDRISPKYTALHPRRQSPFSRRSKNIKLNSITMYHSAFLNNTELLVLLSTCFHTSICAAYSSTLKMEATCSSELLVYFNGQHGLISQKRELFITRNCLNVTTILLLRIFS
jgi:hypothetical protein